MARWVGLSFFWWDFVALCELCVDIRMSNRWFQAFTDGYNISLWHPTHSTQKQADAFRIMVQQFYLYLRKSASLKEQDLNGKQTGVLGSWGLEDIANMD